MAQLAYHVQRDAYRRADRIASPGVHPARSPLSVVHRPNGARDEVVKDVADDFNLPIEGEDPKPVTHRRDRFSHDRRLFHALLMLSYGSAITGDRPQPRDVDRPGQGMS
jgi:hypothetical protein